MVPKTPPPAWAEHQLDGLARLNAARIAIDAQLIGDWPLDPTITASIGRLVDSAAERFRWADACQEAA